MRGEDAARLFYDPYKFLRQGAFPRRALKSFLGEGGVQTLDGETHYHRKMMFMSLMTPESIAALIAATSAYWQDSLAKWETMKRVVLYDEVAGILCRAVCSWAGVPLEEQDAPARTRDFLSMIESPAALGPRHWRGRRARHRADRWITGLIADIRDNKQMVAPDCAADAVAWHREQNGRLLEPNIAAVELINFLRPTVAVALYVVFIAHAIDQHGEALRSLRARYTDYIELFVQEVRRFYPFFPAVAALVKLDFTWRGFRFAKGTWVLLDVYGTNHDPKRWTNPAQFDPERFAGRDQGDYDLIPQGGDGYAQHRCAGEWMTQALMQQALHILTEQIEYEVPPQDLSIDLARVPAMPASKFVLSNVKPKTTLTRTRERVAHCSLVTSTSNNGRH